MTTVLVIITTATLYALWIGAIVYFWEREKRRKKQ
jgi:hypothetical protein